MQPKQHCLYDILLFMIHWFIVPDTMKQLVFGVHLPVMGFKGWNGENEKPHTREQMLSIARKAESLGYDSLSVNDHIVFRTSWLDSLSTLSAVAAVTNRIKLGTSILNMQTTVRSKQVHTAATEK